MPFGGSGAASSMLAQLLSSSYIVSMSSHCDPEASMQDGLQGALVPVSGSEVVVAGF